MTSEPMPWTSLIAAAWPLWLSLIVVVVVGASGHWLAVLDALAGRPWVVLAWLRIRYGLRLVWHPAGGGRKMLYTRRTITATQARQAAELYNQAVRRKGVK